MHALIIEDDAIVAMQIELELRDLGFSSVDFASTQHEGIEAVARHCPDLITSDGSLLEGNGVGAVREIRASIDVPVIFITGDPQAVTQYGSDTAVLEKPFSHSQLCAAVAQLQPNASPKLVETHRAA